MAKVVIFGNSENAEVAFTYLTHDSEHEIVAFTVDGEYLKENKFHDLPVVPYEELEKSHPNDEFKLFMPISFRKVNLLRKEKYLDAKQRGYGFISYISSKAAYYGTPVGENCFILEQNVIQPHTTIGNNCTLWSGNHLGHHTVIKDHVFIASHVVISGAVVIGERTFIGVNATLRDNIKIGEENVIGAGAVVLSDTEDRAVYSPGESPLLKVTSDRLRGI